MFALLSSLVRVVRKESVFCKRIASFLIALILVSAVPATTFAHRDPVACSGSGLGINLYTSSPQVPIGTVISYTIEVFNGTTGGPTVCNATNITASIVTPDGITHPITLLRTSLSHGEIDAYTNVVTYTARAEDVVAGVLRATASDIGTIHQNITDSIGGANQSVNVTIGAPVVPPTDCCGTLSRRPIISVTKTPSPLALPSPGFVTYSYEVSNPGLYTMNNITISDDKCSSVAYLSGDTNNDSLLPSNEVWTYECTTWLTQDTYNTATAIGFANGLAATDTAYATVRIGTQVPPPLIHVVKTPNRLLLPLGGGIIQYDYAVSNPGIVSLYSILVTDNKCSPLTYSSGDTDDDNMLDVGETWNYNCKTKLQFTTTNTVTATGKANNLTAIDTAYATVVVAPRPRIVPRTIPVVPVEPPAIMPVTGVDLRPKSIICEEFTLNFLLQRLFCSLSK